MVDYFPLATILKLAFAAVPAMFDAVLVGAAVTE
jgi:hypothetical protein